MLNLYEILELEKIANIDDIKKAYRKKIFKYHPDTGGEKNNNAEMFRLITFAYEILCDTENRAKYDIMLNEYEKKQNNIIEQVKPVATTLTEDIFFESLPESLQKELNFQKFLKDKKIK